MKFECIPCKALGSTPFGQQYIDLNGKPTSILGRRRAAPRVRAVEIHEEEAAAQKIRRVMQRRKEGRGGEGPSDFEDTSRVQSERKTDAMCSEIKCIDMIWH